MADDSVIKQVRDFVVDSGDGNEASASAESSENSPEIDPASDPFGGPREWAVKWFGPFFNAVLPENRSAGLYLLYVGNYPLLISSSANIYIALTRHLVFSGNAVIPVDVLGREVFHYAQLYRQPLSLKTGLLFENGKLIHPKEHIQCYRRAAAAIAYAHVIPCNKYSRLAYEFDPVTITNFGKYFPLKEKFHVDASTKPAQHPIPH